MVAEDRQTWVPGSRVGYAIVLLGGALFVATCFLPYYEFAGGRSVSLYDQDGGLEVGVILLLFGGLATFVVVAILGLTRGERPSGRAYLSGAVAAWSVTWLGSLLQTAKLREDALIGFSLKVGFWLQAVSIGVAVLGTILVGFDKRTEVKDSHNRDANEERIDPDA